MVKDNFGLAGLALLGIAGYLFLKGKGNGQGDYSGSFPLPLLMQSPGVVEPVQTTSSPSNPSSPSSPSSFQISDKILAAMRGDVQPATTVYSGSENPATKKELSTLQAAGINTAGLQGSYNPSSGTAYTFAPQTPTVEKTLISNAGFDTSGLQGSYDPSTGKITTFAGSGNVSYAPPAPAPVTKKSYSLTNGGYSTNAPKGVSVFTSKGHITRY